MLWFWHDVVFSLPASSKTDFMLMVIVIMYISLSVCVCVDYVKHLPEDSMDRVPMI